MNARTRSLAVLVSGFVLLGMPASVLSVVWPDMAAEFGRRLGDLGLVVFVVGAAYAVASLSIGRISTLVAARGLLIAGALAGAISLAVFASTDTWFALVLAAIPLGVSGGIVDTVGNGFVATRETSRVMGFIHAAFALGAMIGPLLVAVLAGFDVSWRAAFAVLAAAEVVLAIGYWRTAARVRLPMEGERRSPHRSGSATLLALSVWVFFAYVAVEGSVGLWAFTLLTESQGVGAAVASLAISAHWGALFVSRFLLGLAGDRVDPDLTIGVSALGIVVGLVIVWWNPSTVGAIAGLVLAGFASGPVFPLEMLLTPRRFGSEYTGHAAGYQLGAATASVAIAPAVIGWIVNVSGPGSIGVSFVALGLVLVVSVELLRRRTNREHGTAPIDTRRK